MSLVTVYNTHSTTEAHLVKGLLEEHEIAAWVMGDYLQGGVGELQAIGFVQVRVKAEKEKQARSLIEDFERDRLEIDEQDLTDVALHTPSDSNSSPSNNNSEAAFREAFNNKLLLTLGLIVLVLLLIFLLSRLF